MRDLDSIAPARPWTQFILVCSILAVILVIVVRVMGASDAWDQDQPKTMGYTTDIVVNGRWILPKERGFVKASKPPLYNWIAAPAVAIGGFSSELAHKFPSVAGFLVCWVLLVRVGRRIDAQHGGMLGWMAGIMFVGNYAMFKLGYVARPDMVLITFLSIGWVLATMLIVDAAGQRTLAPAVRGFTRFGFWLCVGFAALAKGPPAALLMLYALIGSRHMAGSWSAAKTFKWWWGVPLSMGMFGSWILGVYFIDSRHLYERLWYDEVFGRVFGLSDQGNKEGPVEFVRRLFHMPAYFMARFFPWSILTVFGLLALWKREDGHGPRWRRDGELGAWLHGAGLMVIIIIVFFTLSTGKRADYIAPAYLPAALVSAWWLCSAAPVFLRSRPWLAPAAAAAMIAVMAAYQEKELHAEVRSYGSHLNTFIREVERQVAADPRPLVFWHGGNTHLQGYLGNSEPEDHEAMIERLRAGEVMWIVAGQIEAAPMPFEEWLAERAPEVTLREVIPTAEVPYHPVGLFYASKQSP